MSFGIAYGVTCFLRSMDNAMSEEEPGDTFALWPVLRYVTWPKTTTIKTLRNSKKQQNVKILLKACVRYFLSNFYFSSNDRPSKTMKNAFYFI